MDDEEVDMNNKANDGHAHEVSSLLDFVEVYVLLDEVKTSNKLNSYKIYR